MASKQINLVIISGLSGSGKTAALQLMEDLGFYCIDNLPALLLPDFLNLLKTKKENLGDQFDKVAIVLDARGKSFLKNFGSMLRNLRRHHRTRLVFLESRVPVLLQRYSESRRRHPLSLDGSVLEGIQKEKKILAPIKRVSDKVIDSSDLNVHELKQLLRSFFHFMVPHHEIGLTLISFGFKYGVPIQSDLIFDVRFLPNPHFVKELKKKTGTHGAVKKYVLDNPVSQSFLKKMEEMLTFLIAEYKREGKSYLTISFGCTGGKHRSVAIVEAIEDYLKTKNIHVTVMHRDKHLS